MRDCDTIGCYGFGFISETRYAANGDEMDIEVPCPTCEARNMEDVARDDAADAQREV